MLLADHSPVQMLERMSEKASSLLHQNLAGITDAEAFWRPHQDANNIRWIVGHLAWFEEWMHDALLRDGRYLTEKNPSARLLGTIDELIDRLGEARKALRSVVAGLAEDDLSHTVSYFGRYDLSVMELLETHALHLSGHRFQVRYIRGAYSRFMGTPKSAFDPW
jgi:hypothetical protein